MEEGEIQVKGNMELAVDNSVDWRLPHLDVLRGIAATWIVLFHMVYLTTPNMMPPDLLDKFVKSGGMGVTLFFVISAFSLCLSSDRHHNESHWYFYLRRFFRIAPLFYLIIVVTLFRDKYFFGLIHDYAEIIASLLFVFNFVHTWQVGIVWASWAIGVEIVFYLIFPYIWSGCSNISKTLYKTIPILILSIVAYPLISFFEEGAGYWQWSIFKHLPSFLFGIITYALGRVMRESGRVEQREEWGRVIFWISILLGLALLYSGENFPFISILYWQALIFSFLVFGASFGAAKKLFSMPALRWIGKNSYSIYLTHPLVIVALQPLYKEVGARLASNSLMFLVCACLTLTCVFVISEILWRLVEKPGIDCGRIFIKYLTSARDAQSENLKINKSTGVSTNV